MNQELEQILKDALPDQSKEVRERILSFYELLKAENEVQNLTRLISPVDFYYGHVVDVIELIKSKMLLYPALDIGSGGGIPGLLTALIEPGEWILCESEKRKADFLQRAVDQLGLSERVQVTSLRVAIYLKDRPVKTLIARAVGKVGAIFNWISTSSTWNKLILFKGPGWEEEWKFFQQSKNKAKLVVAQNYLYQIARPEEPRTRILVELHRP